MAYNSDYNIRLATLGEMGGDTGKTYNSVYDIDLDILRLTEQGGGGGGAAMKSVTYSELKSLRNNKQLVAGQQYRITDYVTTTAQENTQSAGRPFDIIVTADDVNKLNENARAINHPNIITAMILWNENDGSFIYERYPDGDNENGYAWAYIDSYVDGTSFDDINTTTFPWFDIESDNLIYSDTLTPSIGDSFETLSGLEVEVTDFSNSIDSDCFTYSKLESWELKYCLDNDTYRFSWAQEGSNGVHAIKSYSEDAEESWICKRWEDLDNYDNNGMYAWVLINDGFDDDFNEVTDYNDIVKSEYGIPYNIIFTTSETPNVNDTTYYYGCYDDTAVYTSEGEGYIEAYTSNAGVVPSGKGVIYYMQDEWNNRCYFDFKNIQFDFTREGSYNFVFENDESHDATINGGSKNNIIEGKYGDENNILTLDTTLNFSDYISNYRGELVTINGTTTTLQQFLEGL